MESIYRGTRETHEGRITREEQERRITRDEQERGLYKRGVGMDSIYRGAGRSLRGE